MHPQLDPSAPSELLELVSQFFHDDTAAEDSTPVRAASVRMPLSRFHLIDVLAERAGVSRNVMANQLLAVGIEMGMSHLPKELQDDINSTVRQRLEAE
jgi:hypothetical protein